MFGIGLLTAIVFVVDASPEIPTVGNCRLIFLAGIGNTFGEGSKVCFGFYPRLITPYIK
jgi:hypothetical protein